MAVQKHKRQFQKLTKAEKSLEMVKKLVNNSDNYAKEQSPIRKYKYLH